MKTRIFTILFALLTVSSSVKSDWQPQTSGTTEGLASVFFVNETTGWAAGNNGKIIFTINGGTVWAPQVSNTSNTLLAIDFPNASTGYMVASNSVLVKTTNGGAVWVSSAIPGMTFGTTYMDFADVNTGYVCGAEGKVGKTTNGGATWVVTTVNASENYNVLKAVDANIVYVAGISGVVQKTTNGGTNWSLQPTTSNNFISSIVFSDASNGYFTTLGLSEQVYRTTNGGASWPEVTSPGTTPGLSALSIVSSTVVYGAGPSGKIRRTTNGGSTWETQPSGDTTSFLRGIFMVNANVGYVVGNDGRVLKTINGGIGIQQISTNIPRVFALEQNYPNPFNPVTNIEFSVPKSGFIKLSVYDVTGKEVAELVNQSLQIGTYKVDFDAAMLSSGIYFYKLETESFIETKKMILVK